MCNYNWYTRPNNIRQGCGWPKCNDTKLDNEYVDSYLYDNKLLIKRIGDYINSYTKINWKCLKCNYIWLAMPCEIMRRGEYREGGGCPDCARGRNERLVGAVLKELNIMTEKLRIYIINKRLYPDFYIPKLNTIIEYNGIQHYRPTCFGSMSDLDAEINFKNQQYRDNLLRKYCNEKDICLLEIDGRKYKGTKLKNFLIDYFKDGVNYG